MSKKAMALRRRVVNLLSHGIYKGAPHRAKSVIAHNFFIPKTASLSRVENKLRQHGERFELSVGNKRVVGQSYGNGPAIVCVHGWGGAGINFGSFVEPLVAQGFRVILYDSAGHGLSGRSSSSFFEMIHSVNSVVAHVGEVAGIVAHSMGAGAAMNLEEERVNKMNLKYVLIAPMFDLQDVLSGFAENVGIHLPLYNELIEIIEREYGKTIEDVTPVTRALGMSASALIFHDKEDRRVPLHHAERLNEKWAGSQLVVSEGLGHKAILSDESVVERGVSFLIAP